MAVVNGLLERWSAIRLARRMRRPNTAGVAAAAVLSSIALAAAGTAPVAGGLEVSRGYGLLVWGEFFSIVVVCLVESAASIAEERRRLTWDAIALTDLTDGELARGKYFGSLVAPAALLLLALPAHLAFAVRGQASWGVVAGVQAVVIGTALSGAGIGVAVSSWTSRGLHAVALAAAVVLFPWFGLLDWLAGRGLGTTIGRIVHPVRHLEVLLYPSIEPSPPSIAWRALAYLVFGGILAACGVLIAAKRLRKTSEGISFVIARGAGRRRARTVWEDPIMWRECHEPGGRRIVRLVSLACAAWIVFNLAGARRQESNGIARRLTEQTNGLLLALMLASGAVVALRGAVTLVDERGRRTLEPLFLAGVEPMELIRSKLSAIFRPVWIIVPFVILFAAIGYGDRLGYLSPASWLGAMASAAIVLIYSFSVAAACLVCSAWASSTRTAMIAGLGLLIAATLGTALVGLGLSPLLPEKLGLIAAAASPVLQISIIGHFVTGHHSAISVPMLIGVLLGELAVGLAALALAIRRLERESNPLLVRRSNCPTADGPRESSWTQSARRSP